MDRERHGLNDKRDEEREREREREVARINHLRGREEERVKRDCRGKGIYNSAHTTLVRKEVDREKKTGIENGRTREREGERVGELYAVEVASIHGWDLISLGNLASYTGIVQGISSPPPNLPLLPPPFLASHHLSVR